jgi:hypothetical protein
VIAQLQTLFEVSQLPLQQSASALHASPALPQLVPVV